MRKAADGLLRIYMNQTDNGTTNPKFMRLAVKVFGFIAWIAGALTFAGLVLAVGVKNERMADGLLALYPRCRTVMDGFAVLEDMKYPLKVDEGAPRNASVLEITHTSWPIFLEFLKSETAIRKSERSDSIAAKPAQDKQQALPPIDFDKVKTIFVFRNDVISAGPKALVPPFALHVLWPVGPPMPIARRAYEFVTFEELRMDLRKMMLDEIEAIGLWMALAAFLTEWPVALAKRWLLRRTVRRAATATTAPATIAIA
jgi:hypothetical protein